MGLHIVLLLDYHKIAIGLPMYRYVMAMSTVDPEVSKGCDSELLCYLGLKIGTARLQNTFDDAFQCVCYRMMRKSNLK